MEIKWKKRDKYEDRSWTGWKSFSTINYILFTSEIVFEIVLSHCRRDGCA